MGWGLGEGDGRARVALSLRAGGFLLVPSPSGCSWPGQRHREPSPCANGSRCSPQPEEKQKAAQQFNKLQAAMKVMGISGDEQKTFWLVLGAICHLGAAGATKGNGAGTR